MSLWRVRQQDVAQRGLCSLHWASFRLHAACKVVERNILGIGNKMKHATQVSGRIAYNGETFDSFFPQRTAAYVDQVDCSTMNL